MPTTSQPENGPRRSKLGAGLLALILVVIIVVLILGAMLLGPGHG